MLKFVVKIVIALAESEDRHEKRVPRAASGGIRPPADGMAGRINKKRAMLKDNGLGDAAKKQSAERAIPAVPEPADRGRKDHPKSQSEQMNVAMLPHNEAIFL